MNLEEDTYELLCLDSLFVLDKKYCFFVNMEYISFLLALKIVEAEQKLEIQTELSTNIRTDINKANSDCNYKPVVGINLVHYRDTLSITMI